MGWREVVVVMTLTGCLNGPSRFSANCPDRQKMLLLVCPSLSYKPIHTLLGTIPTDASFPDKHNLGGWHLSSVLQDHVQSLLPLEGLP